MITWDSVKLCDIKTFMLACRFNPLLPKDRNRFKDYESKCLKRQSRPFQWLHRSPVYAEEFLPLIKKLHQNDSPNQHVA